MKMKLTPERALVLTSLFAWGVWAQDNLINCFGINGLEYRNNTRCPGTDVCCGVEADCLSNRLCHNPNDGADTLVRGPCLVQQYEAGNCPQVCLYKESGPLPRVRICADGSMCCEDEGRRNCCSNDLQEFFFLDNNGAPTDKAPSVTLTWGPGRTTDTVPTANGTPWVSEASSATISEAEPTSVEASSTDEAAVSSSESLSPTTSAAEADNNDDTYLKIGLGVGIPVALIAAISVAGGVIFCKRRRRAQAERQRTADDAREQEAYNTSYTAKNSEMGYRPYYPTYTAAELPERSGTPGAVELPAGRL